MAKIVLISCVKSKRDYRCKAESMYVSPLFKKMFNYAQYLKPKKIFILSAKYGLLNCDEMIYPYEQTLKKMKSAEKKAWARCVLEKLLKECDLDKDDFVFLAGMPYRENLILHIKNFTVPMEGLSFGKQLQWLEEQLHERRMPVSA